MNWRENRGLERIAPTSLTWSRDARVLRTGAWIGVPIHPASAAKRDSDAARATERGCWRSQAPGGVKIARRKGPKLKAESHAIGLPIEHSCDTLPIPLNTRSAASPCSPRAPLG